MKLKVLLFLALFFSSFSVFADNMGSCYDAFRSGLFPGYSDPVVGKDVVSITSTTVFDIGNHPQYGYPMTCWMGGVAGSCANNTNGKTVLVDGFCVTPPDPNCDSNPSYPEIPSGHFCPATFPPPSNQVWTACSTACSPTFSCSGPELLAGHALFENTVDQTCDEIKVCNAAETYNSETNTCLPNPCSNSWEVRNTTTGICEDLNCDSATHFRDNLGVCYPNQCGDSTQVRDPVTHICYSPPPSCSPPFKLDSVINKCVSTTTTTTSSGSGSSSSTTTTTQNGDGTTTSTTTTTNSDGTTTTSTSSGPSSGSSSNHAGSGACNAGDSCDQTQIKNTLNDIKNSLTPVSGGLPAQNLPGSGKTFSSVLTNFSNSVKSTSVVSGVGNFFVVNLPSAVCPVWSVNVWVFQIVIDQQCSAIMQSVFVVVRSVMIIIFSVLAFRVAFL